MRNWNYDGVWLVSGKVQIKEGETSSNFHCLTSALEIFTICTYFRSEPISQRLDWFIEGNNNSRINWFLNLTLVDDEFRNLLFGKNWMHAFNLLMSILNNYQIFSLGPHLYVRITYPNKISEISLFSNKI